jgi:hypothetical protein
MICKDCNKAEALLGPWCAPCHAIGLAAEQEAWAAFYQMVEDCYTELQAREDEEHARLEALYEEQKSAD